MLARTHSLTAFSALLGTAVLFETKDVGVSTVIACLFFNTVGALFPDIDQASNRLWDLFPGGEVIGKGLGVLMRHRGISHSLFGLFLADKLFFWLTTALFNSDFLNVNLVYWSVMIGYISHLLADSLTEEGVPLLFPLKYKFGFPPIKSWRIKTGQWFEKFVVMPGIVVFTTWLTVVNWSAIAKIV